MSCLIPTVSIGISGLATRRRIIHTLKRENLALANRLIKDSDGPLFMPPHLTILCWRPVVTNYIAISKVGHDCLRNPRSNIYEANSSNGIKAVQRILSEER